MLKVGLIGVGGISTVHINAWEKMEDAELIALCDIRPEQLEKYPEKRHYTDFNEMLDNETLDIIDICLPTYLHVEYAINAMNRGMHVLCEKPISLHKEDVKRIYDTAKQNNVIFMPAQVIRFWPEYRIVKECFDSGKYGKLLSGSMCRLSGYPKWSWDNWMLDQSRSGLVPFDLHIHDLDFLVYAFGKPQNVHSFRAKREDQDYFDVVYEFDEFFVNCSASWYASPYPFKMEFIFQFENAVLSFEHNQLIIYEKDGNVISSDMTGCSGERTINLPGSNGYDIEIRYFADCVKANRFCDMIQPVELEQVIDLLNGLG